MKLPYFPFYPLDWLRDTRRLSALAKSIWIDILSYAWNEPERGIYQRTKRAMGNENSLDQNQVIEVLAELQQVADVTVRNENVTVISRRMMRREKHYKNNANRQARHRQRQKSNAEVTPQTLDVRRQQRLTSATQPPPLGGASATRENGGANGQDPEQAEANQAWQSPLPPLPESERMTPEEMKAIRIKNMRQRP